MGSGKARDIDAALVGWEFKPGEVNARRLTATDGRIVLQMRVDLGLLQLEVAGRPDGTRPEGHRTFLDFLRSEAGETPDNPEAGAAFTMADDQCAEADREFLQFYHRRLCWLALGEFDRAVADADHNLAFMDFVKRHAPNPEYAASHEQYRSFVLFHRTQAAAAAAVERGRAEDAVDAIRDGLRRIGDFFSEHDLAERMSEDEMVRRLQDMERELRERFEIRRTLKERFEAAVASEQYELAARLRDQLRARDGHR